MNELMDINVLTMSSDEIANLVESRPNDVKRSIDRLVEKNVISQPPSADGIKSANGVTPKIYLINKRDSFVVVAQLSPEFTGRVVDRWLELEAKQPKKTPLELAREQVVLYEKLEAVEIEREYLKITLDIAHDWSSTKRLEMRDKTAYPWLALRNYSKENGYEVKKVFDQNYGHVNSYHKDVWFAVYEITID
jgi:phage regulator Rha-like protein